MLPSCKGWRPVRPSCRARIQQRIDPDRRPVTEDGQAGRAPATIGCMFAQVSPGIVAPKAETTDVSASNNNPGEALCKA
jgi:hypothetical protein